MSSSLARNLRKVPTHLAWRRQRAEDRLAVGHVKVMRTLVPSRTCTFRELGKSGRLGNQLFQIAGTIGIAAHRGTEVRFPRLWPYRSYFSLPSSYFGNRATIARCEDGWRSAEGFSDFERRYLQDVSLWRNQRERIWNWLQPSDSALEVANSQFGELLELRDKVAIHVRRGDYVDSHVTVPMSYYQEQIDSVRSAHGDCPLLVFSDDISWCERAFRHTAATFVHGNEDWLDLTLMSRCQHHICANSTFSWWGAFLSLNHEPILPLFRGKAPDFSRLAFDGWRVVDLQA